MSRLFLILTAGICASFVIFTNRCYAGVDYAEHNLKDLDKYIYIEKAQKDNHMEYTIILSTSFDSMKYYNEAIAIFYIAKKEDKIILLMNNNKGGYIQIRDSLIEAIHKTKAEVEGSVSGYANSSAATILCYVDKLYMSAGSTLLFHNIRTYIDNVPQALPLEEVRKDNEILKACVKKGLLTQSQLDLLSSTNDVDLFILLNDATVSKRIKPEYRSNVW